MTPRCLSAFRDFGPSPSVAKIKILPPRAGVAKTITLSSRKNLVQILACHVLGPKMDGSYGA